MYNYKEVTTQAEMNVLLESIAGFHDSMAKEFYVINRGFVDHDKRMYSGFQFDGRFLIQSQWEPFCIELLFEDISCLEVGDAREYWAASGTVENITIPTTRRTIKMNFDASLKITASRLFFCERPEWLGVKAFFGQEIPASRMIEAIAIEENWRQCSGCAEIWEEEKEIEISRCPNCKQLTELRR
jgi:hypothetical protein